jgi:hypothetical protein
LGASRPELQAFDGLNSSTARRDGDILCRWFRKERAGMNAIVRMLAVYAGLSLLLCGFTQFQWSPLQPNGFGQWLALFLLIFPAAALAEFLGERLLGQRAAVDFEDSKTHSDCSWGRIAASVALVVVTIGVVIGAAWWLSHPAASCDDSIGCIR